jgi:predicted dehydrogenase
MNKHTLLVLNPGHFHAALTLRRRHPRLDDDVYVYADEGPDVDSFVRIVETFNARDADSTAWRLHLYRGADHLARLRSERRGEVVIVAGRNDSKMDSIQRLHADGFLVLGDKPWLIDAAQLDVLRATMAAQPLAMDIMTERHDAATCVQKALAARPEVFGRFRAGGDEPAIRIRSVHHLYKLVNQRPLVRPAWYFDVAVQGEGISDVTTHLVDLVQWMTGEGTPFDYDRDVQLLSARQWPTEVPRGLFARITGLPDFPEGLRARVAGGALHYLCNAALSYRVRGTSVLLESVWNLAIPEGGGDTHRAVLRGTRADLIVDQGPTTGFVPELTVQPADAGSGYAHVLADAVATLQRDFPGLGYEPDGAAFRIVVPQALRTTHEQHFAAVLDSFLGYIDSGTWPSTLSADLVCKYTLLARAKQLSHRGD